MSKNLVITIGRTFGSGGREIGKKLAEELDMAYFDKELLEEVAEHSGLDVSYLKLFDEKKPPLTIFSSAPIGVLGEERRMEVRIQTLQHEVIEKLVAKVPCVFVGRKAISFCGITPMSIIFSSRPRCNTAPNVCLFGTN